MKNLVFIALFICGSTAVFAQSNTKKIGEASTLSTFQHHSKALGENDNDAILSDYTEGSFVITPDGTFSGLKEIRKAFEA